MKLEAKPITPKIKDYRSIAALYNRAFPSRERLPIAVLNLMAKRKNVDFLAFYDGEQICGLTYLIRYKKITLLFYLAVEERLRSRGYGSKILQWLDENIDGSIVLDIETVDKDHASTNYEQRIRRQQFYSKNDYKDTGFKMIQYGEIYDVLYHGEAFSAEELERLLKWFSFGLSRFIFKIESKSKN